MRIVNIQILRTMPQGTLFQKYAPCYFGDMEIFDHPLGERDFVSCGFGGCPIDVESDADFIEKLDGMAERSEEYPVAFDSYGRDGCFKDDQLFAVWDAADVQALIDKLREGYPPPPTPQEPPHAG